MKLYDYACDECEVVFEELVANMDEPVMCERCENIARRLMPAPLGRMQYGYAETRGGREEAPHYMMMDTRPLAEGKVTKKEWKAMRKKKWLDEDRKEHGTYGQRKVFY